MAEGDAPRLDGAAILAEMAHWQGVVGQAEMLLMEHGASAMLKMGDDARALFAGQLRYDQAAGSAERMWHGALDFWRDFLGDGDAPAAAAWRRVAAMAGILRRTRSLLAIEIARRLEQSADAGEEVRVALRALVAMLAREDGETPSPREQAVVARAIATRGESLLRGLEQMLRDLSDGLLQPAAASVPRGERVLDAPLFELFATPAGEAQATLLVITSSATPFTLLDLPAPHSFLGCVAEQGVGIATLRWKAGDARMGKDHLSAVREALDHVARTANRPIHLLAHDDAATLLVVLLTGERAAADRIASATLLCPRPKHPAPASGTEPTAGAPMLPAVAPLADAVGDYVIGLFLDPHDRAPAERLRWATQPSATSTSLAEGLEGSPAGRIAVPCYLVAGQDDRIAPPAGVWPIVDQVTAPVRLVLSEGGHAGAIIPSAAQAGYRVRDDRTPPTAAEPLHTGRWWENWLAWMRAVQPA